MEEYHQRNVEDRWYRTPLLCGHRKYKHTTTTYVKYKYTMSTLSREEIQTHNTQTYKHIQTYKHTTNTHVKSKYTMAREEIQIHKYYMKYKYTVSREEIHINKYYAKYKYPVWTKETHLHTIQLLHEIQIHQL